MNGTVLSLFWGYPLSWNAKFYLIILMLVMLILKLYLSAVTWLQKLVILIKSASENFFCRNETFGTFFKSTKFQSNHFVLLLPTIQKKKSYPSQTSSASKKICLKLPKIENLAFKFNKGKQSKLKLKPCLKLLCASSKVSQYTSSTVSLNSDCVKLNTLTLPICSSSTVTSASRSSFNFSSGNTAINLD